MIKRILVLFMAVAMLFSFAACSTASTGPALYNELIVTVGGEDITYEYYRYYYLSAYSSYAEDARDTIVSDVLDKLLYDKAVDLLLTDNSAGLTAEEKTELESMLAMYETTYGSTFYTQLKEQNMTVNVFNKTMTDMVKYNKLYELYADEKNGKLDFTATGVQAVLDKYNSGLHFIINKGESLTDKEAKAIADKVYSMLAISDGFVSLGELLSLSENIRQTQDAIAELNKQIANGSADETLVTSLTTLTKKLGELNTTLSSKDFTEGVKKDFEVYSQKVEAYIGYVKSEIIEDVDSDDAELVAMLNGKELDKISSYLTENGKKELSKKLSTVLKGLIDNVSSYGWLKDDFKTAVKEFNADPTLDGAKRLNELHNASSDMKKDTLLVNVNKVVNSYISLSENSHFYEYRDAFYSADGLLEFEGDVYALVSEFAACLEAQEKAAELLESINGGSLKANDISYDYLKVLGAVVYDFEELIVAYSDGYNPDSETQMFYYKNEDLLDSLASVASKLNPGEYSEVIESSAGYHIFMVLEDDAEHFKENYFVYAALEEIIKEKSKTIEYTTTELYGTLNAEKINSLEKELAEQVAAIDAELNATQSNDNTVLWTVIIIVATVAVIAVLAVAIVYSSKAPVSQDPKKKEAYKIKNKTVTGNKNENKEKNDKK